MRLNTESKLPGLPESALTVSVGGLGSYPLSSHSQMRLSWAVTMSFGTKVNASTYVDKSNACDVEKVKTEPEEDVVRRCFFLEHLIWKFVRLKVKVKVDLLKLKLKWVFPHNYFQILSGIGRETIVVQVACLA
jgi:hypothetical protein